MMSGLTKNITKKVIATLKEQTPTCGECVGFKCEKRDSKKGLCVNEGVIESSPICASFVPNTNELADMVADGDTFMAISQLIHSLETNKLRLLGATIMGEKNTRAMGYHMGQKVYVRYMGRASANYIQNFMQAYIMYADREMIRVINRTGTISMTFAANGKKHTIYSTKEFEKMRQEMHAKGRFADPDVNRLEKKRLRCIEDYELGLSEIDPSTIPTIDTVFKKAKPIKSSKKDSPKDLVALSRAIESGFDVRSIEKEEAKERDRASKNGKGKGKGKGGKGITTLDVSGD